MRFIAALCCALAKIPAQPTAPGTTAIEHVNVVYVVAGEIRTDQTVLISNGRIIVSGPAASVAHPSEARIIRAEGKYLLPGLWDMHVHLRSNQDKPGVQLLEENESFLSLFLANGIVAFVRWAAICPTR
jgi:imidazolonepropionase-like amidohydrolase